MKILSYTLILSAYFLSAVLAAKCNKECEFEYGYAYNIGYNNRIQIDPDKISDWVPKTNFTYQLWIKPQVLTSERIQLIFGNLHNHGIYYNHGILIANRTLYFHTGRATQNLTEDKSLSYDLTDHYFKWTHVTATFENKSSDQIGKLYINGKLVAEKNNVVVSQRFAANAKIGSTSDDLFYTGLVDEVRFFNRTFDEEEVKSTWNKVLSQEYIDSDSLLLYLNADGEKYNSPKDKSKYSRSAEWKSDSKSGTLSMRTRAVADCTGCFSSSTPAFCVPNEDNTGRCGDGIVMGDEECDGGDGCDNNCKCKEGYTAHGLPYCMKNIDGVENFECSAADAFTRCVSVMDPDKCDCECYKRDGIDCLMKIGCNTDTIPYLLLGLWDNCLLRCPDKDYCYDSTPEYCVRFNNSDSCKNNNCTWCAGTCVTMKTSCPVSMGNGIIDGCEECDDGNLDNGDGCDENGRKEGNGAFRNDVNVFVLLFSLFTFFF